MREIRSYGSAGERGGNEPLYPEILNYEYQNEAMEEKIIALLQEQNSTAISLLYDNYAPALFGVIIKVVRSHEVAEQVLQDTFVKVWKNSAGYDRSKGKLFTWLINRQEHSH